MQRPLCIRIEQFFKVARRGWGTIFSFHLFSHSITLPLSHSGGSPKVRAFLHQGKNNYYSKTRNSIS
jgi:hypothetical protein